MRLIDVDDLIDFIDMGHLRNPLESCFSERDVVCMLESRLTVDAVPVVRCRECKKKNKKKCPMTIVNFGRDGKEILVQNHVPDDFYCAAGERKEGADNG